MIYFILNKLGSVIYQSEQHDLMTENNKIRYLPLLVIKDLIRANLHDVLEYVDTGQKLVVFKEQQNLLYVAYADKYPSLPVSVIQLHLKTMHQYLKFHYGPHWALQLQGNHPRRHKHTPSLRPSDIHTCLSQLPFTQRIHSIRSIESLCATEQVQLDDDLRTRLTESLAQCCQPFVYSPSKSPFFSLDTVDTWSRCFLFAREKLVVEASHQSNHAPDEFVYFLRLLVSHYLLEKHEIATPQHTLSQSIVSNTTSIFPSSPSSSSSSSLAYVYEANSSSAPFKMRGKSTSSATVVSSDSSLSYWHTQTPRMDIQRVPSNVLHHPVNSSSTIADILNMDEIGYSKPFLSSSVPSSHQGIPLISPTSSEHIASAPSSPTSRSRSQSFNLGDDEEEEGTIDSSSVKHLLTHLMKGEHGYFDQPDDVKLVRRWVNLDGHIYLANLILVYYSGLCAIVVCKDDPTPNKAMLRHTWKPKSSQVKQFKSQLKDCLQDFYDFLLTKEATHFTNLSFALTYPGLVHFIHFNQRMMTAPCLVDLNELDRHHELLHEVYNQYSTDPCPWVWPHQSHLKQLNWP
ncbi:hypothetical protein A0J61_08496 [Choanephora cucurbitarum]|uniref:FUZ/MON1/HPS1 first Longin domain-containing protein n=1 Tax=Choanephora cucurbitarum TaxID=101091 RepID=A0A1C7N456_9FUNG|nr:hypothetical protein A0J61_08496 [Choanephora cucurbitarum]